MNSIFVSAMLAAAGFSAAAASPLVAQTAPAPMGDDGVQTRDEAMAKADARFDKMDLNKDGKLTADEMRPRAPAADMPAPPASPAPAATPGPGPNRMFARLDTNGDGVIDRTEFRVQAARRFDRIDANKDGKIDADERQAARDLMESRMGQRGGKAGGDMPPPPPPAPQDKSGQ